MIILLLPKKKLKYWEVRNMKKLFNNFGLVKGKLIYNDNHPFTAIISPTFQREKENICPLSYVGFRNERFVTRVKLKIVGLHFIIVLPLAFKSNLKKIMSRNVIFFLSNI